VTAEDGQMISSSIEELLHNEDVGKFFAPGLNILTEAEILTPGNERYRPDRIVFEAGKNIVIDFKTGVAREDDKTQVRNYAQLLTGINGKPCELYLVYLQKELRVERVDN
jgi:ATP-dependent helicase/nuclease subunit A